jgi:hypothetical protein
VKECKSMRPMAQEWRFKEHCPCSRPERDSSSQRPAANELRNKLGIREEKCID